MSPLLKQGSIDFISHSETQTQRLGARLAPLLQPGDVIALNGELGTGKTRWVQGICQGLGVTDPVISPTFTLINEYDGRLPVYHIDLYRLNNTTEIVEIGLEDYLYGVGVTLIEWADHAIDLLPENYLSIELHHLETMKRRVVLQAQGPQATILLQHYKRAVFANPHPTTEKI